MFDKSDTANTYGAGAVQTSPALTAGNKKVQLDQEPAWKSDFRQTLNEIRDKGFGAYTDEIQAKKMEELREKILASMGLSEGDLENMSPEQRNQIEKMVALEIQKRLAAEDALDSDSNATSHDVGALADQTRTAPNGLGAGILLLQEIDPDPVTKAEKEESEDKSG